jgi:6-phosphogluconate dehydrogenase
MQLGMVGLGRMGANMTERLHAAGHDVKTFDPNVDSRTAGSLEELVQQLDAPRSVWLMVPAGIVDSVVGELAPHLAEGDTIIDGGNSYYVDDLRRSRELRDKNIHYVDVGVSGGVWGRERGYCLMVGGDDEAVGRLTPVLEALAPGVEAAPRTPGRDGDAAPEEQGWLHCGPPGAGHFVKMVHNGIEYGLMQAYAEGLNVLKHANIGLHFQETDAETTPLRDPDLYKYELDIAAVTELWRRGSVISSWLLDLTAQALHETPELDEYAGQVSDSGEGRWTVQAAVDTAVPAEVLTAALFARFRSRKDHTFAEKILSAMRDGFGGHKEPPPSATNVARPKA